MQTMLPPCKAHNSPLRGGKGRFCATMILVCLYLQNMSRMKLVSFSVKLREVWQKQANVTDNKYFTMRFPLPACNAVFAHGQVRQQSTPTPLHPAAHPPLLPPAPLKERGSSLRVSPSTQSSASLTISMWSLMHYKLIEHKGAEGVSHQRGGS